MGLHIGMRKIAESDESVSYEFDMIVLDKEYFKSEEIFPYKVETHRGYGYCTLNKKTEEFILDEKNTDPFFLKHRMYVAIVWGTLLKILRSGTKFPETTGFTS